MLNFVKLKQGIFKRQSSSYWPNVGVGDIENFSMICLLAQKPFWPIRLELSELCCRDVTYCALKILCEWLINISPIDCPTRHIHTEIEPFTSCVISLNQYILA